MKPGHTGTGQGPSGLAVVRGLVEACPPTVRHSDLEKEDLHLAGEFWDRADIADVEDCGGDLLRK